MKLPFPESQSLGGALALAVATFAVAGLICLVVGFLSNLRAKR